MQGERIIQIQILWVHHIMLKWLGQNRKNLPAPRREIYELFFRICVHL